jgi:hypothetical protein
MATTSRKAQDLKAKEAKQKKILVAGAALLAILLVVQVPKLMHRSAAPVAAPPTVTTPTEPGTTAPAPAAASLADTDVPPAADDGQLVQFDLFDAKDPFVQQVKDAPAATTPADAANAGPAPAKPAAAPPVPTATTGAFTTSAPPVPKTSVARISIGGKVEQLVAKAEFPADAPAFELVSFTIGKAEIAVAGGSFKSGDPTLTLLKGQTVTLENTADGSRYVLVYRGAAKVPTDSLQPTATEG